MITFSIGSRKSIVRISSKSIPGPGPTKVLLTGCCRSITIKKEALDDFNTYSQEFLKGTVWSDDCRAGLYKNGRRTGRVNGLYAGSMMHFKNGLEQIGGEHFDIVWRSKNRFRCLGNGTAETDENGTGNLAPYMDEYLD